MKDLLRFQLVSLAERCATFGAVCSPTSGGCCKTLVCSQNATGGEYFCGCEAGYFFDKPSRECTSIVLDVVAMVIVVVGSVAFIIGIIIYGVEWWKKRLQVNTPDTEHSCGDSDQAEPVEPMGPSNRSDLHMILLHGLSDATDGLPPRYQTVIETFDFPPTYPGPPQEELPPTYEQVFDQHHSIR